jgi:hypothetical protein
MTTPRDNSSLAEASAGRHVAQFHRDAEALSESAYLFLEGGLRRGTSVVIIATPANAERLLTHLSAGKFHPTALRDAGQLEVLDAATVLEQCMSGGGPEWGRFRATLGAVLDRARAVGHGTRIYADTTGMLWQDGNTDAAIRIEELWNALGQIFPFALYCGYMLDTQSEESYGGPLEEIGRTHTEIVGTIEDERFAAALDRASKEIFGISLSQMAGVTKQDGERRFPSGQRTMLWVKRNLPSSTARLAERARHYYKDARP